MQTLDVNRKEGGRIWHRKPTALQDGILTTITNNISSALSPQTRNVRFLHASFDVVGDCFVTGDYQGNIYLFDLNKNKFSLVQKTGSPCSAIAFTLRRRTEFLVAMADYSLKCFDTESKELVAWMKGHSSIIHTMSIHASGRYALTSSGDAAQLWDLDTFQRKRKLNIKENVGILKVFFLPLSNTIITCFKDDSIFAWEADTFNCKFQLKIPDGSHPQFKAFAATRDGRLLIAGGRSRHLHLWSLDTRKLMRIIELPSKVTSVKQLEFLPDQFDGGVNQVVGVLSQDGIMRYININTCKLLFDIGEINDKIYNAAVSGNGRHIVAVMESGNVKVYSVEALTADINKPPPPLVKVLKDTQNKHVSIDSKKNSSRGRLGSSRINGSRYRSSAITDITEDETGISDEAPPPGLDLDRLTAILKGYGEYPAKYRMFIWRNLLNLPENHAAYAALVDKGTHPAYEAIHEKYPIKSRKLLRVLQRLLSALAHWSPIFGETDYLPMLAFPFVKLFQNNQLVCFEIIASLLVNWGAHWFEYFPNPPINMLGMIENVLAFHDKELLRHLVTQGVNTQIYAWPVLETLFSEVLTKEEWLKLFDNIFSRHPSFLLMVVVAYCITSRGPLMKCSEIEDFQYFFHHQNPVNIGQVIKEANKLMNTTPSDIHPSKMMNNFTPLTHGQYPVFNKYPKFIVDYQVQERERIRQEEIEYIRQKQSALRMEVETEARMQEEEAFYRQQQLLKDAEEKRRKLISEEEEKLADQRTRLTAMNREVKMKELQMMDATRRKFMQYQQGEKEVELTRLDDEIRRKAVLRDLETQQALDEAESRNLELQLQKKVFEQELLRDHVTTTQQRTADYDSRRRQHEIDGRMMRNIAATEHAKGKEIRHNLQHALAASDQIKADVTYRTQLEMKHQLDDLEKDKQTAFLLSLNEENRQLEKNLHGLMGEVGKIREQSAKRVHSELVLQKGDTGEHYDRRIRLIHSEMDQTKDHLSELHKSQNEMFGRLKELRHGLTHAEGEARSLHDEYLNESSGGESSVQLSLDRGRGDFDRREKALLEDVRHLRQKVARDGMHKRPPTSMNLHYVPY